MEKITSRQNEWIKEYRRLRDSRQQRYAGRLFVLEGNRLCLEAAQNGVEILRLLYTPEAAPALTALFSRAQDAAEIPSALAEYISDTKAPQGVFCVCRMPEPARFQPRRGGRYLLLDRLQNPGNVGTAIRTAEACGFDAALLSQDSADLYSPKVLRGAMGSVFRLPSIVMPDLSEAVAALDTAGIACWAAALYGQTRDIRTVSFENGGGLVIGNEGQGISAAVLARCSGGVMIPMAGKTESLNAAAAAAIAMWELSGRSLPLSGEDR